MKTYVAAYYISQEHLSTSPSIGKVGHLQGYWTEARLQCATAH